MSYLAYTDDTGQIEFPIHPRVPLLPEIQSHTQVYTGNVPCDLNGNLLAPEKTVVTYPYSIIGSKLNINGDDISYELALQIIARFYEGENLLFCDTSIENVTRYFVGVMEPPQFTKIEGSGGRDYRYNIDLTISAEV